MQVVHHGALHGVTGSCHQLLVDEHRSLLIDCGLFQGLKDLRLRNWDQFPLSPSEIDEVVLTHAHIDHTGLNTYQNTPPFFLRVFLQE